MNRQWHVCGRCGRTTAFPCGCRPTAKPLTRRDVVTVAVFLTVLFLSVALVSVVNVWIPS